MTTLEEMMRNRAYQGEITNTPRNRWLGGAADFLDPANKFLDRYKLPESIPLLGGLSAADLTPLKGTQGLLDDASYGKSPIRGASLQTATVDPRLLDIAGLGAIGLPLAKNVGKAALREGARQIETGTGLLGKNVIDPRMEIVPNNIPKFPKTDGEIRSEIAQRNAALPISEGGLGLPANNMPMDRAGAMNAVDYLHGTERLDRLLSGKNLDPKRATSGPMPFGTDSQPVANGYALTKQDTSRQAADEGRDMATYFQVSPKSLGYRGTNPYTVEQSWYHLSPKVKADILDKSRRLGYQNKEEAEGPWTIHPTSEGMPFSPRHFEYELNAAKGNPLTALRRAYGESGMLGMYDQSDLANIYKTVGYPHEISQTNAPWTEAKGVFLGKAMINKPLVTSNTDEIRNSVIPALKKAFENDRTRLKLSNSDLWDKNSRWTPKTWVNELEKDLSESNNSYVWTSIPDKVTEQLKKLGYQGIIDTGGKGGGSNVGHQVVIPFQPSQVRSRFAAFDPFRKHEADILAGVGAGGLLDPEAVYEEFKKKERK